MNKDINKLIDETLDSVNDIQRATPKPFLMTRIHARMNNGTASAWERAGWFITRPAVAFAGLCLVLLINVMVMMGNSGSANGDTAVGQGSTDEFAYNMTTIYDIENTQP